MTFPPEVSPLDLRRIQKPKGKRKKQMNKMIKMAAIAVGAAAMFAGCSGDVDKEYESILREMAKENSDTCSINVDAEMKKFKAMTPEQKQKELKSTKAMFDAMK